MDGEFNRARWRGTTALLNQRVCKIETDPGMLDDRYLYHFLPGALKRIEDGTPYVTVKHLSARKILDIQVPVPPLTEQQRIATILDKVDLLRSKRRDALARLNQLTQSVFINMFGDPVTNTRGWPEKALGDIGVLDRGVSKHRPRNDPRLLGGPYPLVQTGEVSNSGGYITSTSLSYSDAGLAQSKMWRAGTLCITIVGANIAKTGILTFDACFPDSVVGFTPKEPFDAEYVRIWLGFLERALVARAPESARKNLNLAILGTLPIPVPPRRKRRVFSEGIGNHNQLISYQKGSLKTLGYSTGSGLGLGLPGARRLMDNMTVESVPGHGTVVEMWKWISTGE